MVASGHERRFRDVHHASRSTSDSGKIAQRSEPTLRAMTEPMRLAALDSPLPFCQFYQGLRCLHEQDPQVTIAALRYLAEDGAVSSRDLPGHQSKPGGEVAALDEHIAGADRRHRRARD